LQVHDIWFRPPFALFFVDIHSREVIHVATTRAPTEQWTAQQLRNIAPFGHGPEAIIRDRDQKYGKTFDRVAEGAGIEVFVTALRTPTMNATCERFLGSAGRECLDHIIILGERRLQPVLEAYCFPYFNTCRSHQRIRQRIPVPMSLTCRSFVSRHGTCMAQPGARYTEECGVVDELEQGASCVPIIRERRGSLGQLSSCVSALAKCGASRVVSPRSARAQHPS
jgi:hypothetical protein